MDVVAAAIGAVMPFVWMIPVDDDEFNTSILRYQNFFPLISVATTLFFFLSLIPKKKKRKTANRC